MRRLPPEPPVSADEALSLRSRTDGRRAERAREEALEQLAEDLARLRTGQLEQIGLDEELMDSLSLARIIKSPPARKRQIRAVRIVLRSLDWWALRSKVDHLREHGTLPSKEADGVEQAWVVRLLGEGSLALDELSRMHPRADRSRLRMLVRNAQKASAERRKRAEQRLARAIREILVG